MKHNEISNEKNVHTYAMRINELHTHTQPYIYISSHLNESDAYNDDDKRTKMYTRKKKHKEKQYQSPLFRIISETAAVVDNTFKCTIFYAYYSKINLENALRAWTVTIAYHIQL